MTSEKQAAANRRNAEKSTGPKTAEGKAKSSRNAVTHGLRAASLVLPTENQQDFDNLFFELEAEWRPQSQSERLLVEQMAVAQWKLLRTQRAQNKILIKDPDGLEQLPALDRLYQIEARFERSFFRAYKELDRMNRLRQKELSRNANAEDEAEAAAAPGPSNEPRISPGLIWEDPETGECTEAAPPHFVYPDGHMEVMPATDPRRAGLKRMPPFDRD